MASNLLFWAIFPFFFVAGVFGSITAIISIFRIPKHISISDDVVIFFLRYHKKPLQIEYGNIEWMIVYEKHDGGYIKIRNMRGQFFLEREKAFRIIGKYKLKFGTYPKLPSGSETFFDR